MKPIFLLLIQLVEEGLKLDLSSLVFHSKQVLCFTELNEF